MLSTTVRFAFFLRDLGGLVLVFFRVLGSKGSEGNSVDETATTTTVAGTVVVVVSAVGDDTLTVIVVVVSIESLGLDDEFGGNDVEENSFVGRSNVEHLTSGKTFILDIREVLPQVVDVDVVLGGMSKRSVDVLATFRFLRMGADSALMFEVGAEMHFLGDVIGLSTLGEGDDIFHGDGVEFISGSGVDFNVLEEVSTFNASGTTCRKSRAFLLLMMVTSRSREESDLLVVRVGRNKRRSLLLLLLSLVGVVGSSSSSSSSNSLGELGIISIVVGIVDHFLFFFVVKRDCCFC